MKIAAPLNITCGRNALVSRDVIHEGQQFLKQRKGISAKVDKSDHQQTTVVPDPLPFQQHLAVC